MEYIALLMLVPWVWCYVEVAKTGKCNWVVGTLATCSSSFALAIATLIT